MRKPNLIVSEEHWKRTHALRVPDVEFALRTHPEKLYDRKAHDQADVLVITDIPNTQFKTEEEMLAAVKKWCE